MRHKFAALLAAFLLLTLNTLFNPVTVRAKTIVPNSDDYDYEETARVVRVSLIHGDVSLRRAGSKKWERATLNLPLVEGDRLATGQDSRIEIQIDSRNFVRVGEYATLDIVTLRNEGIALSLAEGTATVRLARFNRDHEYFEIDAPKTTVAAEKTGTYRLDVSSNGKVVVAVRNDGRARIYNETSGFTLKNNRSAELAYDATDDSDWEFSAMGDFDDWDRWVGERERYLAARLRYDHSNQYYDADVYGAEELDAYGDWTYVNEYGWLWHPHTTVVNIYHDWAPYRYGHWAWCPPYGWTWVGDEAWGWAPYHYGRWVYYNNYWCWAPRGYYGYQHSWWRPALVAFTYIPSSYGENICWYPLGYHQPDPHARYYRQPARLTPLRADEIANLQRTNPAYLRAVTTLPARDFGTGMNRAQPANIDLARRAMTTEPVRGRLSIRPVDALGAGTNPTTNGTANGNTRGRGLIIRNDPSDPMRPLPERPTGAARRMPGIPLDGELQRVRLYNNREPRPAISDTGGATTTRDNTESRPTGAVTRPARPIRLPDTNNGAGGTGTINNSNGQQTTRPVRPIIVRPDPTEIRPRDPVIDRPERKERRPIQHDDGDNHDRPSDSIRERPARPDRREDRPTPQVRERPSTPEADRPAPHIDRPEPRVERPSPREERPASPPPPPPREERPAPPPQREERPAPREERKSDPPPARNNDAPAAHPSRSRNDPPLKK